MDENDQFGQLAEDFLRAAWARLERDHVVPTPSWHPHIRVGTDYEGVPMMALPEFQRLNELIESLEPRFRADVPLGERAFANAYIFTFLEACVALSARERSVSAVAVKRSIGDLRTAIRADSSEVAACRVVSHLTTPDRTDVELAGLRVAPIGDEAHSWSRDVAETIGSVIQGAGSAYGRNQPVVHSPPESVVIARAFGTDPYSTGDALSARIERFVLAVRLLWSGTCLSGFEIQGETMRVRRFSPTMQLFRGAGPGLLSPTSLVRRTVRISAEDGPRVEGILRILDDTHQPRPEMALTSFGIAMRKFQLSFHAHDWTEQLVDLATALEGVISGAETSDVVLRLKTRAAALLATDQDPASAVFDDVNRLYILRSHLIHGGEMKHTKLNSHLMAVSTVPAGTPLGTATGYVIDRMRDLVRRSLLVRICLATGTDAVWALGADAGVDAALADDRTRSEWRARWRAALSSFDAEFAADQPRGPVDVLSPDDR